LKSHLDKVVSMLDCFDDFEIIIKKVRATLPTAEIYPNRDPPLIVIKGNIPSLVRYSLADLILHEKSHIEYMDYCNKREVVECVDHHESQVFRMIDEGNRNLLSGLVVSEHE